MDVLMLALVFMLIMAASVCFGVCLSYLVLRVIHGEWPKF